MAFLAEGWVAEGWVELVFLYSLKLLLLSISGDEGNKKDEDGRPKKEATRRKRAYPVVIITERCPCREAGT